MKYDETVMPPEHNLNWVQDTFNILGIIFSKNLDDMVDLNYSIAFDKIKGILNSWSYRFLTILGKITVIKSLAIPKINYYCLTLPNPPTEFIKNLNSMFFDFIWSKKPDKVKRFQLCNDYEHGGVKMVDIGSFMKALKLTWVRKIYQGRCDCFILHNHSFSDIFKLSTSSINDKLVSTSNDFWADVFIAWIDFNKHIKPESVEDFLSMRLWNNPSISIAGNSINFPPLKKGVFFFVNDLFDDSGNYYEFETFCLKFNVKIDFMNFYCLKNALAHVYDLSKVKTKLDMPLRPLMYTIMLNSSKGCQDFYRTLNRSIFIDNSKSKNNWSTELMLPISFDEWASINRLPFKLVTATNL